MLHNAFVKSNQSIMIASWILDVKVGFHAKLKIRCCYAIKMLIFDMLIQYLKVKNFAFFTCSLKEST